MKNFKLLMLASLAIILFSCEKENLEVLQEKSSPKPDSLITKAGGAPTDSDFERTMQWTSFFAMQTLYSYPETRVEFDVALNTGSSVKMEDLIGDDIDDSIFKERYLDVVYDYIFAQLNPSYPKNEGDPPPVPITQGPADPPCAPFTSCGPDVQSYVDYFVNEILVEYCIEIYTPSSLDYFGDDFEMTSTAHPLNDDVNNQGHRKGLTHFPGLYGSRDGNYLLWITEVDVDNAYVILNGNVIVARPYRPSGPYPFTHPCAYMDYPTDLTLFLD